MLKSFRWTAWILMSAALATMVGAASPRNLPKAIETQLELQSQRPQDPKVANDLGNLLVLAKRSEEAEMAYQRAIELAPGDAVPLYNLALLKQQQGRTKEALNAFKSVVEIDPGNAWAHYQVGALYEAMDEKARAVAAYGRAFSLDPQLASSRVNPQVIDSKWVVEAMLQGYREAVTRPLAPQAYEDPNRIAMLMISSPDEAAIVEGEVLAEADLDEAEETTPGRVRAEANLEQGDFSDERDFEEDAPESPETVATSPEGRRVLTSDSIDKGSTLGEVGRAGSANPRNRRLTATRRPSSTYTPPRRGTVNSGSPDSSSRGRTTGRNRYRPSTRSTGSLELELLPGGLKPSPAPVAPAG